MKITTIIYRLQRTILNLKKLQEHQFNYLVWASEYEVTEEKNVCGTVCCVGGWYATWYPELFSLKLLSKLANTNGVALRYQGDTKTGTSGLCEYHGMGHAPISALFTGYTDDQKSLGLPLVENEGTLPEVINLFEQALILIKQRKLDDWLDITDQ